MNDRPRFAAVPAAVLAALFFALLLPSTAHAQAKPAETAAAKPASHPPGAAIARTD